MAPCRNANDADVAAIPTTRLAITLTAYRRDVRRLRTAWRTS
jgi:hypothetical protein